MNTKNILVEIVLIGLGLELLNHSVYQPFLAKKTKQGKRVMWGNMLVILGGILTAMGALFYSQFIFSQAKTLDLIILLALLFIFGFFNFPLRYEPDTTARQPFFP